MHSVQPGSIYTHTFGPPVMATQVGLCGKWNNRVCAPPDEGHEGVDLLQQRVYKERRFREGCLHYLLKRRVALKCTVEDKVVHGL